MGHICVTERSHTDAVHGPGDKHGGGGGRRGSCYAGNRQLLHEDSLRSRNLLLPRLEAVTASFFPSS